MCGRGHRSIIRRNGPSTTLGLIYLCSSLHLVDDTPNILVQDMHVALIVIIVFIPTGFPRFGAQAHELYLDRVNALPSAQQTHMRIPNPHYEPRSAVVFLGSGGPNGLHVL